MILRRLLSRAIPEQAQVPTGSLQASLVNPRLGVHFGVPEKASIIAYEPVQRLLALGTRDGRVKIFGGDGVEGMLESPSKAPSKFIIFFVNRGFLVHVTTHNNIEVWDLEKQSISASCKWDTTVTAICVCQGTSYLYIGDDSGVCRVLAHDAVEGFLRPMQYCIPPHITLGGLVRPGSSSAPSLVGILEQPGAKHSRLLLAYDNGVLVLWGLHEKRVLVIRGGTRFKLGKLVQHVAKMAEMDEEGGGGSLAKPRSQETSFLASSECLGSDDDEDDLEICCVAWACPLGGVVAAGYTSGDVLLWSLPPSRAVTGPVAVGGKEAELEREREDALWAPSNTPVQTIQLVQRPVRLPIAALRWSADANCARGGGRLYVLGGGAVEAPETVVVLGLNMLPSALPRRELPWFGPVADVALAPLPAPGPAGVAAAAIVLTSPGQVHVFDEAEIARMFVEHVEGAAHPSPPQPVTVGRRVVQSRVTASGLWCANRGELKGMDLLIKLPRRGLDSQAPASLPGGSPWPITGGSTSVRSSKGLADAALCLLLTGHKDGQVLAWDASTPLLPGICQAPVKMDKATGEYEGFLLHPVTALDFCPASGMLAVGHEDGAVHLYILCADKRRVELNILDPAIRREKRMAEPGFQCIAVLRLHKAAIKRVALATGVARLAVGTADGMVSVLDLSTLSVLYHDRPVPTGTPGHVVSLAITALTAPAAAAAAGKQGQEGEAAAAGAAVSAAAAAEAMTTSKEPVSPKSPMKGGSPGSFSAAAGGGSPRSPSAHAAAAAAAAAFAPAPPSLVLAAFQNSLMVALDGTTGQPQGAPVHPMRPSACVRLLLLDANGNPVPAPVSAECPRWFLTGPGSAPSSPSARSTPSSPLAPSSPTAAAAAAAAAAAEGGTGSPRATSSPAGTPPTSPRRMGSSVRSVRSGSGSSSDSEAFSAAFPSPATASSLPQLAEAAAYVLLCSEDSLRLYSLSSFLQGDRTTARKVKLEEAPCWGAAFGVKGITPQGLVLIMPGGGLQIRSLPDLAEVKRTSIAEVLGRGGHEETSTSSNANILAGTASCAPDGRMIMVEGESEVLYLSLIATENGLGLPQSRPSLHDDVLAAAIEEEEGDAQQGPSAASSAAGVALATLERKDSMDAKKKKSFFGAMTKDISSAIKTVTSAPASRQASVSRARPLTNHTAADMTPLFASRPFTALSPMPVATTSRSPSSIQIKGSSGGAQTSMSFMSEDDLGIDDLGIDDEDEATSRPPQAAATTGRAASAARNTDAESQQRSQLFSGGSATSSSAGPPQQRTAAEIRAAYGHRSARPMADAGSIASQARDKLMERQEKLEGIGRRTAEMQADAENFASMAEELAKKMEKKSGWW